MHLVFIYFFFEEKKTICICGNYSLFSCSIIYIILFYYRDIKDGYVILVKNFNINVMQSINIYDARKFHSL